MWWKKPWLWILVAGLLIIAVMWYLVASGNWIFAFALGGTVVIILLCFVAAFFAKKERRGDGPSRSHIAHALHSRVLTGGNDQTD